MAYIIKMPKLGLEMERGTVIEWKIEPGEDVSEGEVIVEVESEKSIGEVEAREDGTLRERYLEEGESVPPGTPIGILAAPDADIDEIKAEAEAEIAEEAPEVIGAEAGGAKAGGAEAGGSAATEEAAAATGDAGADSAASEAAPVGGSGGDTADVKASPRAEKRAEELEVDLSTVEGTGFDGAITEEDVEAAAEAGEAAKEVKASPRARQRAEELGVDLATVEGTGFEGAVTEEDVEEAAERMDSAEPEETGFQWLGTETPQQERFQRVTTVADPAAGEMLFETMEAVRAAFEKRVTMTDILLVITSEALGDRPVVNGTYTESTHQVQETQNIALVADVGDEPTAGIIPGAETKSLTDIVEARQSIDETTAGAAPNGATFTLTNAAETERDGRLINPPAVAALEVDPTGQRAIPSGKGVNIQPLVRASLTYDSRAIGTGEAQAFLDRFCELAEQASQLVLGSYHGTE